MNSIEFEKRLMADTKRLARERLLRELPMLFEGQDERVIEFVVTIVVACELRAEIAIRKELAGC